MISQLQQESGDGMKNTNKMESCSSFLIDLRTRDSVMKALEVLHNS